MKILTTLQLKALKNEKNTYYTSPREQQLLASRSQFRNQSPFYQTLKESQCDQIFNSTQNAHVLYLELVEKQDQRKSGWMGNLTRPVLEMLLHPRKEELIPISGDIR